MPRLSDPPSMEKPLRQAAGLRTEIILNIVLLLAGALLFAAFLLLKLTERELVAQRSGSVVAATQLVARALAAGGGDDLGLRAAALLREAPGGLAPEGWRVTGEDFVTLAVAGAAPPEPSQPGRFRFLDEPEVRLRYPAAWLPFGGARERYVEVAVPLQQPGGFAGLLQARFSLADVHARVAGAYRLALVYAVLYGAALVPFGVYLLNRTVVRPVRRLREGTAQVAAGDLEAALPEEGPRELAELATSFNAMTAALRGSRAEREAHIASLQEVRAELLRSERMASVGHLAAGMAHEIGNPLGAVVGYLDFLRGDLPEGPQREILGRALAEAGRIDRLVRDLLDYAAPDDSAPQRLDPAAVLVEAREILEHQGAFAEVSLNDELPPALPEVRMARHKLLQVCVNLLLNARDASPAGGTVALAGGAEGDAVWLSVADRGAGMPAEVQAHIFDPFFTTKEPGQGRGLGLSVCHRVIEEAGGSIAVSSQPGEGSVFTIRLRRAEADDDD